MIGVSSRNYEHYKRKEKFEAAPVMCNLVFLIGEGELKVGVAFLDWH